MGEWKAVPGTLKQIAVGGTGHIWGVQDDAYANAIWRFDGDWRRIGGSALQVDVAMDGTTYCIDSSNVLFRFNVDRWIRVTGNIKYVAVGSATDVWGLNTASKAGRIVNDQFQQVGDVTFANLSVGSDGTVWGVNVNGNIYKYDGTTFIAVKGTLHQISVGSANAVWGVQTNGMVWRYTANGDIPFERIPGELTQVSVGGDGAVWGVQTGGKIFYYLPDAPLVVSNFRMMEKYFQPGEDGKFAFQISNLAFGTTLTNIRLELLYDRDVFGTNLVPKDHPFVINEPLPYGITRDVPFVIHAKSETRPGQYSLYGVKASATLSYTGPGGVPVSTPAGGWMRFEVKED